MVFETYRVEGQKCRTDVPTNASMQCSKAGCLEGRNRRCRANMKIVKNSTTRSMMVESNDQCQLVNVAVLQLGSLATLVSACSRFCARWAGSVNSQ